MHIQDNKVVVDYTKEYLVLYPDSGVLPMVFPEAAFLWGELQQGYEVSRTGRRAPLLEVYK